MLVNKAKSGILAIRNDLRTRQIKQKHFSQIPVLTKYKYLGVEIQDTGKFKRFVQDKHKLLKELTNRLSSTFRDLPDTSIKW